MADAPKVGKTKARRGTVATDSLQDAAAGARDDAAPAAAGKASVMRLDRSDNVVARYAGYSKKGFASYNRDKKNQDRGVWEVDEASGALMLCVFDGHGPVGEKVSALFKKNMPPYVFGKLAEGVSAADAMRYGLRQSEDDLFADPRIDKTFSGTTAVCCLIIGNKLTVANVGDSRIILASRQGDKDVAEEVSIDHKPERPDEKARIHAAGGRVFAEIFEDDDMDGPARVWLADMDIPGLAMSRSMGDAIAKQAGVISTPEVYERTITDDHTYLIMGSDGLWEFISNQESVDMVTPLPDCATAVDRLVAEANRRWTVEDEDSIDDTTVIVAFFDRALAVRNVATTAAAAAAGDTIAAAPSTVSGGPAGAGAGVGAGATGSAADNGSDSSGSGSSGSDSEGEQVAPDWKKYVDHATNKVYFFNSATKLTIWEDPTNPGLEGAIAFAEKAKAIAAAASSGGWQEHVDPASKRKYWFNPATKESRWTDPAQDKDAAGNSASAGGGSDAATGGGGGGSADEVWEEHVDPDTRKRYYFNKSRRQSLWTRPKSLTAVIVALSGADASAVQDTVVVVDAEGNEWEEHTDKGSKRTFYFCRATGKSSWTKPAAGGTATAGAAPAQAVQAPAVPGSSAAPAGAVAAPSVPTS